MELNIFEILKVIFLGIVEGITEWLPISSTGHMLLVDEFLKLNCSDAFKEMFFVVIQLGAILAVIIMFWNKLWPFHLKTTHFDLRPLRRNRLRSSPEYHLSPSAWYQTNESGTAQKATLPP